jgi:hypothetical protein
MRCVKTIAKLKSNRYDNGAAIRSAFLKGKPAMEMLRKITISTCGFDKTAINLAIEANGKQATELLKIAGITTGAKPGQTDKGEYLKLIGEFRAVNLVTGELFSSSACILPNFVTEPLAVALESSPEVEFGLLITAKPNAKSVTGYEFGVVPLVEAKASDKLAGLLESSGMISENLASKLLPAAKSKKAA